jgi:hypothetical protein
MSPAPARPVEVRVTVADGWTTLALELAAGETAAALKRRALAAARIEGDAGAYEVKVGGALVRDETKPLTELGVGPGTPLIVLSRRRRPAQ